MLVHPVADGPGPDAMRTRRASKSHDELKAIRRDYHRTAYRAEHSSLKARILWVAAQG